MDDEKTRDDAGRRMSVVRFKKLLLNVARLRRRQMLRPLRHRVRDQALRSLSRQSVAKGVAVGVFCGVLIPVAQIALAIVCAILLRANVVVAAVSTFVSNPLTVPFVYYWAFRTGSLVLGRGSAGAESAEAVSEAEDAAEHALEPTGWFPALADWVSSVGPPLAVGIVTLAAGGAAAAYVVVFGLWGYWKRAAAWRGSAGGGR